MENQREEASEMEWLAWFAREADFGPAHGDVMLLYQEQFEKETGKRVPANWQYE